MIRRLLNALTALLLLAVGLVGLPVFLLGAYRALAAQLPHLGDLPSVLLSPGDGGLFLLLLFAVGWVCWVVFATAFAVEVIARVRGIRTPHLGAFFPQTTMARTVSSIALLLTLTPTAGTTLPATAAPAPTTTTTATATAHPAAAATASATAQDQPDARAARQDSDEEHVDYVVERGDTLWDIADEQLDNPTRYPEIFEASDDIDQPDGRHLTDPDLILPGWTLHIPTETPAHAEAPEPTTAPTPGPAAAADSPTAAEQVVPPTTPMQSPDPATPDQDDTPVAAGVDLPATPMAAPPATQTTPTEDGHTAAATAAVGPAGPALPTTPMSAPGGQSDVPAPDLVTAREAVYDDEGRFAPNHGVLGLPDWITDPLIPTRPEDAGDLVAAAHRQLAAARPGPRSTTGEP